jgi:serine/threonine protein kinase
VISRTGQQIGNYRLVRLLGQGGFAEVWLGEHIHLHTSAALKILQPLDPTAQNMFLREAKVIASLSHPNIIRLIEYTVENTIPVIIMEFAQNGTLRTRHQQGSVVPLGTVLSYLQQIAPALDYAHSTGIIHRDIKPDNMLIKGNGEILLSDFGIVAAIHSAHSMQTGRQYAGTASYSAPEQLQGKPCPASDQYALGIMVYEWLSGTVPFTGLFMEVAIKHLTEQPEPLSQRAPSLPKAISDVVMQTLAKDPTQRYPSVREFIVALEQAHMQAPLPPGTTLCTYTGHSGNITALAYSPNSKFIASGSDDTTVQIWEAATGKHLLTYTGHTSSINSLEWSPDGKTIASAGDNVHVWEAASGQKILTYSGHADRVRYLAWSQGGKSIISVSFGISHNGMIKTWNTIHVWTASTGKLHSNYDYDVKTTWNSHVVCSPDRRYVALGADDWEVKLLDTASSKEIHTFHHQYGDIVAVAWSPNGKYIVSANNWHGARLNAPPQEIIYDEVNVWDVTTGRCILTIPSSVDSVAWSSDGKYIVMLVSHSDTKFDASTGNWTISHPYHVEIWDAFTGKLQHAQIFQSKTVKSEQAVIWSPNSKMIACVIVEKTIHVLQAL